MSEIEKIQRYIERTKIDHRTSHAYCMYASELCALYDELRRDSFQAMSILFNFGWAKGYRAAKAEAKQV